VLRAGAAALVAVALAAGVALAVRGGGPPAVMPMGDSITLGADEGGGFRDGYRVALRDRLADEGVAARFVGGETSEVPDLRHEGHGGWRIDQLRAVVDEVLAAHPPDVVLLQIGTNDIGQGYDLDRAPYRLQELAARICDRRPGVELLVASVLPIAGLEPQVASFNAWVPGIVAGLQQGGCAARFVDLHAAVPVTDLFDGVHPRPAGYARMARVWADEVAAAIRRGGTPPAPGAVNDDALTYAGYWARDERPGAHRTDTHTSANTGDTAELGFGGSVVLRGTRGPDGGIAAVSVDGGPETLVDYYAPVEEDQAVVYRGPPADGGWHVLRLRVVGRSGPGSTGAAVSVDRVDVVR
jgi:lysophospholipase L1-like esterase